jgi:hypothetical protein
LPGNDLRYNSPGNQANRGLSFSFSSKDEIEFLYS